MKRSERRHLRQNAIASSLAYTERILRNHRGKIIITIGVFASSLFLVGGYLFWESWSKSRASSLLAEAIVVSESPVIEPPEVSTTEDGSEVSSTNAVTEDVEQPSVVSENSEFTQPVGSYPSEDARLEAALTKFLAVVQTYPSTSFGVTARYHAAGALASLNRTEEAVEQYLAVVNTAKDGIYLDMARLGLADAQLDSGNHEGAIQSLKKVLTLKSEQSDVPVDAVLRRLGRAYRLAGLQAEALQTFSRIIDEFPSSPYSESAKQQLENLKQAIPGTLG